MKNSKLMVRGILNALGVLVYIFLVSLVLNNGQGLFGPENHKFITPIFFLLLFLFSALLTGFLVLGKPLMLYLDGAKKEGVKLLFYTGAGLFVMFLIVAAIMIAIR